SSQTLTEQVSVAPTRKATTLDLVASVSPAVVNQNVTFTATVRDPSKTGTPTGTVTFYVGNTPVKRVTLVNGQASLTGFFSVAGLYPLRAVYSGDAIFDTSSSQPLNERVN